MGGRDIVLDRVSVHFGNFIAVQPTDLTVRAGEFFSILGPSGCGKTTLLRTISGFVEPTAGRVLIGGAPMAGIGPNRRPTAMIFQNLALFPLMSVWENVAFGLEARGVSKWERRWRAEELLALVALSDQADKKPGDLSGGQRQRVAIARALAVEPAVLLLDEPLSALDLKLRQHMRAELRAIQRRTGVTFLYITHDQGEALTMSDRIAVMRQGMIEQVGGTAEVYDSPATSFVASFVGESNRLAGRVVRAEGDWAVVDTPVGRLRGRNRGAVTVGQAASVFARPEKTRLIGAGAGQLGAESPDAREPREENCFEATFVRRDLEGPFMNLFFERDGVTIIVHMTNTEGSGRDLQGRHGLRFAASDALVLACGEDGDG